MPNAAWCGLDITVKRLSKWLTKFLKAIASPAAPAWVNARPAPSPRAMCTRSIPTCALTVALAQQPARWVRSAPPNNYG